ncbi:Esterase [Zancudomyces culisetae]|uniref:Esterase n=1 Tax=Zancudomyces culisetae TaxID=1213189 RepID=A0A1R1PWF3_ZANCU|nr:Esterase [Zancudomyces culisetae]|eukprot:OMH85277.1 Esterase [Zancudomyces culisetae]
MSDLYGVAFPKHLGKEEQDKYLSDMEKVMEDAKRSFIENGPKLPSWTLETQVAITRVKAELKRLLSDGDSGHGPTTSENFNAEQIGKSMAPLRDFDSPSISEKGKFTTHYWKISAKSLFIPPSDLFKELCASDQKLAESKTPRELYTEVVASNDFIARLEEQNIDLDSALGMSPLHEDEKVIIHYHGGGFCLEAPSAYRAFGADICKETGYRVFLPYYRLAPEDPFPRGIYDGYLFFQHLINLGYKHENIIISGDSAGCNMCLTVMINLRSAGQPQPKCAILHSPWVDLNLPGESYTRNVDLDFIMQDRPEYIKCNVRMYVAPGREYDDYVKKMLNDPMVSPTFADFTGLAPMMVISGEVELLVDDIDAFASKLGLKERFIVGRKHPGTEQGKRNVYEKYAGMGHIFFFIEAANEKHACIEGVGNYIRSIDSQ